MSSVAHPLGAALPVADAVAPVLVVLLGGGLVGMSIRNMFESIMSEDEASEADPGERDASTDGSGGLMAEASEEDSGGDDDLGDLGGFEDDDDLGGFEDDGFGDVDEGGAESVDELEHRLDELETEMGSLSSTVNTVRNENEQISESVGEVEENVRKLLDIYEMVTRGVNPFADDVNAGMAGGGMGEGGGFGLFDDEGSAPESDAIDKDIAEADAEGFFDEELVDDEEELEADADVGEVLGDEEEDDGDEVDEDFEDFEEDEGGGTSFQDLKKEYESGDAEWAEEDGDGADASEEDADAADAAADTADPEGDDDPAVDEELDDIADDELFDEVVEEGAGDASDDEAASGTGDQPVADAAAAPGDTDASNQGATASTAAGADTAGAADAGETPADADDGRPYLATLPEGFAADLLVVEWLEFLVGEAGVRETARAIDYYESIDWIAEPVAEDLQDYLAGFDGGPSGTLTIDHHTRSLRYVGRLDGGGAETAALQRMTHGGGSDGIQR